ncbi:hypothetical protein EAH79_15945 [Sphingomonas koreensis]|nr:hypothetical protein EAH79_15945 [Sphingomonas koreensis]
MRVFKFAAAGATALSMVIASSAIAAPTRSAAALPSAQNAPVSGIRAATPIKRKSSQSDGSSAALGYGLAAIVLAGIVVGTVTAVDDNNSNNNASSPG